MKTDIKILLYNKISIILPKEWDPIGIQNTPEAHDEYEVYAAFILELIISGKTYRGSITKIPHVDMHYHTPLKDIEKQRFPVGEHLYESK